MVATIGMWRSARATSHGVPNFPDPKVITRTDDNQEVYLPGVNFQAPAVQSAVKACGDGPKGPWR